MVAICTLLFAFQALAQNASAPFDLRDVVFEADAMRQDGPEQTIVLSGNVLLDDGARVLSAERLTIDPQQGYAAAQGDVQLQLENGEVVRSQAMVLDERATTLLIAGLSLKMRQEAILAAASAQVSEQEIVLQYASYTACNAPCDIDESRQRNPLPWQLTAREVRLDQQSQTLHLRGLRLSLFEWPVLQWPALSLPAPDVERRSGVLAPVAGFKSGEGAWAGLPLFLTLGPSADLTATPVLYSSALTRLDTEARMHTLSLKGKAAASLDADGRGGAFVEADQTLSPTGSVRLKLDWAGETERGALRALSQTGKSWHANRLGLNIARGHSAYAITLHQDRILSTEQEWAALNWDESWVPRAQFDLRLPPLAGGSRLRVEGQGLLVDREALVETSAAWNLRAVTRGGIELTPLLQAGLIGNDASGEASPWIGGQMGVALPLVRRDQSTTIRLAPRLALSGLTPASVKGSPHHDAVVPSRASLFDLRSSGDPYAHAGELRVDAAIDFALYPHQTSGRAKPDLGLRGSLAQRVSWNDDALQPALGQMLVQAGRLNVDLQATIDTQTLWKASPNWPDALPRMNLDMRLPLGADVQVSGQLNRLRTAQDQIDSSGLRLDLGLTDRLDASAGFRTKQTRDGNSLGVTSSLSWNFAGDWFAEAAVRQNVFSREDQDLSFDLFHRCDCLGLQFGVLRERSPSGTEYSARLGLDLPTLFQGQASPTVFRHR